MTVVNMLSFGDSGAAITDEQASSYVRKLNVANKLRVINNFVFGGSGIMDFLEKTYDQLRTVLPEKCDFNELSKHLSKSTISFINNYKDSCIQANYNISLSEFQAGKTKEGSPLDLEFKKPIADYFNQLNKEIVYPNSILVGGINGEKFEIYYFYFGNCSFIRSSTPYASIGSGSDEAGRILSSYIEQKTKEGRKKIERTEGLIKLIEATNQAGIVNIGVGGVPQIMYCDKNRVREVEEEKCILLSEIVKGYNFKQLDKDFVYEMINSLVFGGAKFEEAEQQMKSKAKDWDKFERLLRGYKV